MPLLKNAKHEHFAQLLAKGMTPPKAYVAVGYSEQGAAQSANRLLKIADVAARVVELRKAIEEPARERAIEKAAVDKAWVLHNLTKIVAMGMQAEPVMDDEGNPTGEYKQNLNAANKALELVGKELGMFVERKEVRSGPLEEMPRDDLKKLIDVLTAASEEPAAANPGRATH